MGPLRGAVARAEPLRSGDGGPSDSQRNAGQGGSNRVAPQGQCGRKTLPGAEVQRFTEQSTREPSSPLGTNSLVRC